MKNVSLILNVVLLVAVGVLFYFHFSSGDTKGSVGDGITGEQVGELHMAFVNGDSVVKYYEYLKVNQKQLEDKRAQMSTDLDNRAKGLQSEVESYQKNRGNLTISQDRIMQEDLTKKNQNLQMYEQSLQQELMGHQEKLSAELYKRITEFLKKYGQERGLHLVLKYDATSDVLYGSEGLDITKEVVDGLNNEYKVELATTLPDSTK